MSDFYLKRYAWPTSLFLNNTFGFRKDTSIIVVIPAFNEPQLLGSLEALVKCDPTVGFIEVFIVINESEEADEYIKANNQTSLTEIKQWINQGDFDNIRFHCEHIIFKKKHAGVGLARKVGMDDAVRYFEHINKPKGIILCFDADSACDRNFLSAVEQHFMLNPKCIGASIHFEHPLTGELPEKNYKAIVNYELFLRYYINALAWTGFPYAHQTIGSSMCVINETYQKQGGMNKRKAGEDFYFLNKIIPLGEFHDIATTKTIPAARSSDRVPFGTGRDISNQLASNNVTDYETYNTKTFEDLKKLFTDHRQLYSKSYHDMNLPVTVKHYMNESDFETALLKMRKEASSPERFTKKFFDWWNAFSILKFIHFTRDHYYPNVALISALEILMTHWLGIEPSTAGRTKKELLIALRQYDIKKSHR